MPKEKQGAFFRRNEKVFQISFCVLWVQWRNVAEKDQTQSVSLPVPGMWTLQSLVKHGLWGQVNITFDKVSRKQSSSDLSFLCLSDKVGGNHPSDPSYSTSSSKEYWLTSGDNTLPFLSFSSTLFLLLCSWSFSFWRAWTCSEIFIFSSAVLLWSCTFFSDNSWSSKFRRVDIFKLSVFKA